MIGLKQPKVNGERHFARLRRSGCCIPNCMNQDIVVHHDRNAATSGTGLKPPPWHCLPVCNPHHTEGHQVGWKTMAAKYGVDFSEVARGQAIVSRAMGLLPKEEER